MPTSKNGNHKGSVLDKLRVEYRLPRGSGGYKEALREQRDKDARILEEERKEYREDMHLMNRQLTAANERNAEQHKLIVALQRELKRIGGNGNGNGTPSIGLAPEAQTGEKPQEHHEEEDHEGEDDTHSA